MFQSPARVPASAGKRALVSRRRYHVSFISRPLSDPVSPVGRPARGGLGRKPGLGPGSAPEHAGRVRFLRAVVVLVAVLLRGGGGARQWRQVPGAMRRPALLL